MAHAIKPNHGTEIPASHFFFDTETVSCSRKGKFVTHELSFRLGCWQSVRLESGERTREKQATFTETNCLWDAIDAASDPVRPLWVWAHNLGFDLTIARFWEELDSGRYHVGLVKPIKGDPRFRSKRPFSGFMCLQGRPTFLEVLGPRGRITFCDLGNYLPTSLETIGRSLGVHKWPFPGEDADDEALAKYCQNDVTVLKEAVLYLLQRWHKEDCGVWQKTAGSLSFTSWRHIAERQSNGRHRYPVVPQRHDLADALERESYFGGWTECLYYGEIGERPKSSPEHAAGKKRTWADFEKAKVFELDLQSAYPAVMAAHFFPTVRTRFERFASLDKFTSVCDPANAIARVFINSDRETFPVRLDNQLVYARGRFWTTLAGPELKRAFASGVVADLGEVAVYETAPIFRTWVNHWWKIKLAAKERGNQMEVDFANMILRSLYGKWAQGGAHWEDAPLIAADRDWGEFVVRLAPDKPPVRARGIAGNTQIWTEGETPDWAMPCISSFITAYARELIRQVIAACPAGSVYHVATDAIHCSPSAYNALLASGWIQENTLGKLSVKGAYLYADYVGANTYQIDNLCVQQGSWGRALEVEKGEWQYDAWQQLPSIVRSRPDGKVLIERKPLDSSEITHKAYWHASGWTIPYRLGYQRSKFVPLSEPAGRWATKQLVLPFDDQAETFNQG